MEGIFAVSNLEVGDGEDYSAFTLSCESKFPDKMPYAVTLYTPGGDNTTGLDWMEDDLSDISGIETHIPVAGPYKGTTKQFLQVRSKQVVSTIII